MTTSPEIRSAAEEELVARFRTVAKAYVDDLQSQGRLVEVGGANVLERLRTEIEGRGAFSDVHQKTADVICDTCAYPRAVADRIATALQRAGVLRDGPEPQHDRADTPAPQPSPSTRGALVMHREPGAAPSPKPAPAPPRPVPAAAAFREGVQAAAGWDASLARAESVAVQLRAEHAGRLEAMQIAADAERVTVAIKAVSLQDWTYWLAAIGARVDVVTRQAGYAQIAPGRVDGVDVHLTAHEVPRLLAEAMTAAGEGFYLWGRVYDLTVPQVDRQGRAWLYLGMRKQDGMPMLTGRGSTVQAPLASVVVQDGPLLPEQSPALPSAVAGGEL
ncbi:BN159_2729 family protein [Streptomyces phaeochromogenes]|uniref:BN159_2729 family protein n=1 Tax=Streptomyces phaeochromogenes TaxID=1923 RepID=UPI002255CEA9|nr:BN159_2729 family protein [Streptomyces phaeochromogenes]MCX5601559.1 BN159_2729 family protein [Streptomyces phaeochromogenes]